MTQESGARRMHTRSFKTERRVWPWAVALISLLSLGLRWHYVSTTYVPVPLGGDASQYFLYAWNLAHHGVFSLSPPNATTIAPDSYRDPGYPLFLAMWMKVLGDNPSWYVATLLSQAVLGALTVTLSLQISRHWLSIRWAAAAGLLMATWPHNVAINGFVLTETLTGFLCALGMLLWSCACKGHRTGFAIASGFVFGLAALTNSVFKPFCLLLAIFTAWRNPQRRKISLLLVLSSLALPSAWAVRNAQLPSVDIHSTSEARAIQNLVQGSWPAYHPVWRLSKLGDETARANAKVILSAIDNEYELLLVSPAKGICVIEQRMAQHPFWYIDWYLFKKPYELWSWDIEIGEGDIYPYPVINSPFQINPIWRALAAACHAINPLLWLFALASLPLAWWNSRIAVPQDDAIGREAMASVLMLLAFVSLVYTLLQAEPRYSIPLRAFEIALALTSLSLVAGWWNIYRDRLRTDQR